MTRTARSGTCRGSTGQDVQQSAQKGGQSLVAAALTTDRQPCCCRPSRSLVLKDALTGCLNPFHARLLNHSRIDKWAAARPCMYADCC